MRFASLLEPPDRWTLFLDFEQCEANLVVTADLPRFTKARSPSNLRTVHSSSQARTDKITGGCRRSRDFFRRLFISECPQRLMTAHPFLLPIVPHLGDVVPRLYDNLQRFR